MFQIGESLREARTRRGFTAADVHKAIRIRERYLTALEEERWDMLPGEAYTKGFLRTYSDHLGLDGQLYVDEYNARIARHDDDPPPFVPHPSAETRHVRRRVFAGLAGVLVVGAAVAGLAAWRLGSATHDTTTPPTTRPQSPTGTVVAALPPPRPAKKHAASRGPVFTSISATRGRCWLLVRAGGPNGTVLYEGTLEQGQAKRFPISARLWVRMGNPDALDITVAGKAIGGLPTFPANVVLTRAGAA